MYDACATTTHPYRSLNASMDVALLLLADATDSAPLDPDTVALDAEAAPAAAAMALWPAADVDVAWVTAALPKKPVAALPSADVAALADTGSAAPKRSDAPDAAVAAVWTTDPAAPLSPDSPDAAALELDAALVAPKRCDVAALVAELALDDAALPARAVCPAAVAADAWALAPTPAPAL